MQGHSNRVTHGIPQALQGFDRDISDITPKVRGLKKQMLPQLLSYNAKASEKVGKGLVYQAACRTGNLLRLAWV